MVFCHNLINNCFPVLRDPEYVLTQVDPPLWEVADTEGELRWDVKALPATEVQVEYLIIL